MTQAAAQLDVSRVALSRVLNGRAAISPEMALRIEAWLGVARGGEARLWLAEQSAYDVWQGKQRFKAVPMLFRLRLWLCENFAMTMSANGLVCLLTISTSAMHSSMY